MIEAGTSRLVKNSLIAVSWLVEGVFNLLIFVVCLFFFAFFVIEKRVRMNKFGTAEKGSGNKVEREGRKLFKLTHETCRNKVQTNLKLNIFLYPHRSWLYRNVVDLQLQHNMKRRFDWSQCPHLVINCFVSLIIQRKIFPFSSFFSVGISVALTFHLILMSRFWPLHSDSKRILHGRLFTSDVLKQRTGNKFKELYNYENIRATGRARERYVDRQGFAPSDESKKCRNIKIVFRPLFFNINSWVTCFIYLGVSNWKKKWLYVDRSS